VALGRLGFILTTRYETPTSPNYIETPTSPTTGHAQSHAPTTDARTPPRQLFNGPIFSAVLYPVYSLAPEACLPVALC
jgi:hypothetical protein